MLQDAVRRRSARDESFWAGTTCSCSSGTASSRTPTSTSRTTRSGIDDGTVGGIFCIVSETTGRVLGERRLRALSALGSRLADRPTRPTSGRVAAVLGENPADVPFAALYLDDGDGAR